MTRDAGIQSRPVGTARFLHVDAFAEAPFAGNPAGVVLLERAGETEWLQAVASELNLPATAFVWPEDGVFGLRWFTAAGELALCGHGTLSAAHVLWEEGLVGRGETVRFRSQSGRLAARPD